MSSNFLRGTDIPKKWNVRYSVVECVHSVLPVSRMCPVSDAAMASIFAANSYDAFDPDSIASSVIEALQE